jgi:hypothetical protein
VCKAVVEAHGGVITIDPGSHGRIRFTLLLA